jgi:hypothetical protein
MAEPFPLVGIDANTSTADEGRSYGPTLIVSRTRPWSQPLNVLLEYEGTATPNVDYQRPTSAIVIPAGSDSASEVANAGKSPKGMDLAGGVVGKEIRSGVLGQRGTCNPDEERAHGLWQGHDCRDLTADSKQLRLRGVAERVKVKNRCRRARLRCTARLP